MATEITTWAELAAINSGLSGDYILMNDLDSSSAGYDTYASSSANSGAGWLPLGDSATKFTGTFDGDGFTISDIYISRSSEDYIGLFGYLGDGATISNTGVVDCDITGLDIVAGFVGYDNSVGASISNCYSTGSVSGDDKIGGFVGSIDSSSDITISNCYSHASVVAGDDYAGGFAGSMHSFSTGLISNCYSTGSVSGDLWIGGFVSYDVGSYSNNFYDSTTSGKSDSNGATPKTTAQMQSIATFSAWDIVDIDDYVDEIWYIDSGLDYPRLGWEYTEANPTISNISTITGVTSITI